MKKKNNEEQATLTVEQQSELASQVLGMLMSRVQRDETTDFTGFNISKQKLGVHCGVVLEKVKHGLLQPTKVDLEF